MSNFDLFPEPVRPAVPGVYAIQCKPNRRADLALERKISDERLREIERLRSQRWWLAGAGLTTGAAIVIGIWRLAGS